MNLAYKYNAIVSGERRGRRGSNMERNDHVILTYVLNY